MIFCELKGSRNGRKCAAERDPRPAVMRLRSAAVPPFHHSPSIPSMSGPKKQIPPVPRSAGCLQLPPVRPFRFLFPWMDPPHTEKPPPSLSQLRKKILHYRARAGEKMVATSPCESPRWLMLLAGGCEAIPGFTGSDPRVGGVF